MPQLLTATQPALNFNPLIEIKSQFALRTIAMTPHNNQRYNHRKWQNILYQSWILGTIWGDGVVFRFTFARNRGLLTIIWCLFWHCFCRTVDHRLIRTEKTLHWKSQTITSKICNCHPDPSFTIMDICHKTVVPRRKRSEPEVMDTSSPHPAVLPTI